MPVYKNNGIHARLVREERQIPEFFACVGALAGAAALPIAAAAASACAVAIGTKR